MVALHPVSTAAPDLDPAIADEDLVIALAPTAHLDRAGADALVELAATNRGDAWFGDIEIAGETVLRGAWSPTRILVDPTARSPLAVRARWLRAHGVSAAAPDLPLQLAQHEAEVIHVNATLTHHDEPPGGPDAAAVAAHVAALGLPAGVDAGRLVLRADHAPEITIVVPTAGARLPDGAVAVERLLDRLADRPARIDVVLVVGDEFDGEPTALATDGCRVVRRPPGPFNFARAVNLGVLDATAPLVLLLNDDTEPADHGFVDQMAVHLADPGVGAVGALLTYPDGTVQHAGMVLDDARPLHPFVGWDPAATRAHGGQFARDVVAVTAGCMLVRRRDFLAVGGLSPTFPLSFNDVDLCVRLRRTGLRVVVEPAASLVHHETLTREPTIAAEEWDRWIHRWGEIVDPWYHPAHHRPDDPTALSRNADHLAPVGPPPPAVARPARLRSRVHRGRPATAGH